MLENTDGLAEGTEVTVRPVKGASKRKEPRKRKPQKLRSGILKFAGKAKGLPPDASVNLDHYLYGHAKR